MISIASSTVRTALRNASTSNSPSMVRKCIRFSDARLQAESSRNMYSEQGLLALMRAVFGQVCQSFTVVSNCRPGSPHRCAASAISRELGPVQKDLIPTDPKTLIGDAAALLGFSLQDLIGSVSGAPKISADLKDGRPVVDMTGAEGFYDLTLPVTQEDYQAMLVRSADAAGVALPAQALRLLETTSIDSLVESLRKAGLTLEEERAAFEGYFAYNFRNMGGLNDLFGQLWKEYALSDSRYLTQDAFVLCMETVTAVRIHHACRTPSS